MNETPTAVLDQAAFQRVWRRVMPQDRTDCPFTLDPPSPANIPAPQPLARADPAPVQAPPQAIPCLGEASMGELPALEARMEQAAQAQRAYQALERRARRRGSFASLAGEKARQIRRLAAAYFLISGMEFDPLPGAAELSKNTALALRDRFRAEQLEAAALMDAAQATADPCLAQLYRELAEENRGFADRVRAKLEQK